MVKKDLHLGSGLWSKLDRSFYPLGLDIKGNKLRRKSDILFRLWSMDHCG